MLNIIAFAVLSLINNPPQTEQALTDFTVKMEWTDVANESSIQSSPNFRYYSSTRIFAYVCDRQRYKSPTTNLLKVRSQYIDPPTDPACLALSQQFERKRDPRIHDPGSLNFPVAKRGRSSFMEFSVVDFYRRAIHELRVSEINDAVLVLSFWRYGSSIIDSNVIELLDERIVDFLSFTAPEYPAASVVLDSSAKLPGTSAQANIKGSFQVENISEVSPFYDLNVPLEIYRSSIMKRILGMVTTEGAKVERETPLTLDSYLRVGILYFSFQNHDVWKLLKAKLSAIDFQAPAIGEFLANDRVARMLKTNVQEALNVYLYYYRANLEDVGVRVVTLQEQIKNDPRSRITNEDGVIVVTGEAQERLARYQLTQMQVRDSLILFDAVTHAGRAYLDQILR